MNPLLLCSLHVLALFIFHSQASNISSSRPSCHPEERSALLNFKASFTISTLFCVGIEKTASWNESFNCCQWHGIGCHEVTGHVIKLDLRCSRLKGIISSNSSLFSLRHLQILDLSYNDFQGSSISPKIGIFNNLTDLFLSGSNFRGDVPQEIGHLSKLSVLSIWGEERISIGDTTMRAMAMNLTELKTLDLYRVDMSAVNSLSAMANLTSSLTTLAMPYCRLYGELPEAFPGNFLKLNFLDLSSNSLSGDLEIEKISKLKDLGSLRLSSNNFSLNFRSTKNLSLNSIQHLDLSYSNINLESSINISLNNLKMLQLRSCNIKEFPTFIKSSNSLDLLDLSINSIQGNVPKWFGEMRNDSLSNVQGISLSKNQFVGNIPIAFCNMSSLIQLDLSHNNFGGTIPGCITNSSSPLSVLDLQMNDLHGNIPSAFAKGSCLNTLNLNGNRLEGSLPQSLLNCRKLELFDIGKNDISGPFPQWLESLPELQVLILRGNNFYGPIGSSTVRFPFKKLRIMDLSHNKFTGWLPKKYFENLLAMMDSHTDVLEYMESGYYQDSVTVVMKGFELHLEKILTIFTTIDLSSNNFEGDIPSSIGKLKSLKGLNLSHNNLVGLIPISLGNLSNLEWLDLSSNRLNGEIPKKLAEDMIQLSFLNLSFNALEGQIPGGKQFNTFENDSYLGNLGLYGPPLSKTCYEVKAKQQSLTSTRNEDEDEGLDWKIVMLIGYGGGLVFGVSMGLVIIHDTTIHRIMEIVNCRNQGSSKKLNGRKVRSVRRGRN